MPTLEEIETRTKLYADAFDRLADAMRIAEEEISRVRRARLPAIKRHAARAAEARQALHDAIADSAPSFVKPRTRLFHGIRVGLKKGAGKVEFADAAQVVRLIRRRLPDRVDELVKITETPIKAALEMLTADDLKRIGVTIEDTGDQVVIKPADGEIEKLVNALLAGAPEPEEAAS